MPRLLVLISVLFAIFVNFSATQFVSDQLIVKLNHGGILIGRHMTSQHGRNVRAFLGVPYAKPPVGNLRFSDPEPADAWNGTLLAISDDKSCVELDVFFQDNVVSGTEDCLYLNVYIPEEPKSKAPLPVMVWIHGGGYIMGTGASRAYHPKLLMDRDIVLVSINYRTGPFGFLSSETLDMPGNFGLKDQVLALKWVQENIAAFGGNPQSVTIFGESAGGASVNYLTISPQAKGLFQRAIAQSGSPYNPWAEPAPKGYAAAVAKKLVERANCGNLTDTTNWAKHIDCLRKVEPKTLEEMSKTFWEWKSFPLPVFPVVEEPEYEKAFLTKNWEAVDFSNAVPIIMGYTSEEGLLLTRFKDLLNIEERSKDFEENSAYLAAYRLVPKEHHPMIKTSIKQFYFPDGTVSEQNYTNLLSDVWFLRGIDKLLKQRVAAKAPTFVYTFEHKGLSCIYRRYNNFAGSSHLDDVLYLFPANEFITPTVMPTKRDIELREHMLDLWTNFATYGNPTPKESQLPEWPATDSYPPKMLQIGNRKEDAPLLQLSTAYPTERIQFWEGMYPYLVEQYIESN